MAPVATSSCDFAIRSMGTRRHVQLRFRDQTWFRILQSETDHDAYVAMLRFLRQRSNPLELSEGDYLEWITGGLLSVDDRAEEAFRQLQTALLGASFFPTSHEPTYAWICLNNRDEDVSAIDRELQLILSI